MLMRCTFSQGGSVNFKVWTPDRYPTEEDQDIYSWPSHNVRFLWSRNQLSVKTAHGLFKEQVFPGDIWIVLDLNQLLFVGPYTDDNKVNFHADWDLRKVFEMGGAPRAFQLFQPGPARKEPLPVEGLSAIDRVLKDDILV